MESRAFCIVKHVGHSIWNDVSPFAKRVLKFLKTCAIYGGIVAGILLAAVAIILVIKGTVDAWGVVAAGATNMWVATAIFVAITLYKKIWRDIFNSIMAWLIGIMMGLVIAIFSIATPGYIPFAQVGICVGWIIPLKAINYFENKFYAAAKFCDEREQVKKPEFTDPINPLSQVERL